MADKALPLACVTVQITRCINYIREDRFDAPPTYPRLRVGGPTRKGQRCVGSSFRNNGVAEGGYPPPPGADTGFRRGGGVRTGI